METTEPAATCSETIYYLSLDPSRSMILNDGHKPTRVAWLQVLSCMSDSDGGTRLRKVQDTEEAFQCFRGACAKRSHSLREGYSAYFAHRAAPSAPQHALVGLGQTGHYSLVLALQRGRESASSDDEVLFEDGNE